MKRDGTKHNKPYDNRAVSNLKHGRDSETVKDLQRRLDLLPLKATDKMELQRMIDALQTQNLAFDIDSVIKSHLVDALQSTDKKLVSYLADLGNTQLRIAESEKSVHFHKHVLDSLKEQWLNEPEVEAKQELYKQIQESEKTINMFERQVKDYLELRNKIRKEIDKGNYQEKQLKMKSEEMAGHNAKPVDIDFSVLED